MLRVAGVIVNLVPYHHARWEAFATASDVECHIVELTNKDAFGVLEYSSNSRYQRHTLFIDQNRGIFRSEITHRLFGKLCEIRPDVVCLSGWAMPVSIAGLRWASKYRVPSVMMSESNEFDERRSYIKEGLKRRVLRHCAAGLAGGQPQRDYLAKLGLSSDRIWMGYDAVDNDYFAARAADARNNAEAIRNERCLPVRYFFACARFAEKKNLPRLIEAYSRYRQLCDENEPQRVAEAWELVIAGDGEKRAEIEAAIARHGLSEMVHLVGAQSYGAITELYGLASCFVHASTTEQWGLVVNEAMASGLPALVSNRCGCARDLVREGQNGYTFDPLNIDELARLMGKVSADKFPLAEFSSVSQQVVAIWGPQRFARGLQAAVKCAIDVGPPRASGLDNFLLYTIS
jgi:glycosyltransferase involved in cell wall biosynthesis